MPHPLQSKPPYVCNGCGSLRNCTLQKSFYSAATAQKKYETRLFESRSGISTTEEEVLRLDRIISPLIQRGQSIHHICSNNRDVIMHSEKSIYNYIDYNLFSARNIDLPRKVVYRPRKKSTNKFKVNKSCRIGLRFVLQTYPQAYAFHVISVRQTRVCPQTSFRFHLAVDTLVLSYALGTINPC